MRRRQLTQRALTIALAGLAAWTIPATVRAASVGPSRLVVVELFTSQGCSSCPPADALLREMSASPDILPLAFHVTYWNYLGWRDPFSFDGATERQRLYARTLGENSVYTPQLVVDGLTDVVGSDRRGVGAAIASAGAKAAATTTVSVRRDGDDIAIAVGPGGGAGAVHVVSYDSEHRTPVGRGENGGRTLVEANVVRSFTTVADWSGGALTLRRKRPEGEHVAVFIQAPDGRILGAAKETDRPS